MEQNQNEVNICTEPRPIDSDLSPAEQDRQKHNAWVAETAQEIEFLPLRELIKQLMEEKT